MIFIGDIHGKFEELYYPILQQIGKKPTIQIGDMGHGFPGSVLKKLPRKHKFIRGNHDNPQACKEHYNYLGDFGYIEKYDLFFFSGAYSIDKNTRTQGIDWWPDEELGMHECYKAFDLYKFKRPHIVVSHDCPDKARIRLLQWLRSVYAVPTRTGQILQRFLDSWQPSYWIFGHYHFTKTFQLEGIKTTFICLGEGAMQEIEL